MGKGKLCTILSLTRPIPHSNDRIRAWLLLCQCDHRPRNEFTIILQPGTRFSPRSQEDNQAFRSPSNCLSPLMCPEVWAPVNPQIIGRFHLIPFPPQLEEGEEDGEGWDPSCWALSWSSSSPLSAAQPWDMIVSLVLYGNYSVTKRAVDHHP